MPRARWGTEVLAETFHSISRQGSHTNGMISNGIEIPKWMTTGKTFSKKIQAKETLWTIIKLSLACP